MTARAPARALVLGAATASSIAGADPRLRVTHEPPPRTLRMRPRKVAQTPAPPPPPPSTPSSPPSAAPPPAGLAPARATARPGDDDGATLRDLDRRVSFSIDLGYQVDSASPSGRARLGARPPVPDQDWSTLRAYGFGEVFGATRGLGLGSLSTYFNARFQATRRLEVDVTPTQTVPLAAPIGTWFERSGVDLRSGWAEMRDFLPARWGLSRLRARAGSQYVYGPWVMHLDGLLLSYDGPILTASTYTGVRHSDYTRDQSDKRPTIAGSSIRVDLRGLPTSLPLALGGEVLAVGSSDEAMQPASTSTLVQGDWRPRRDIAVIGQFRWLDGSAASQRLELRARYRQVTNLVVDVIRRTEDDWRWDPSLTAPDTELLAARRYLDLGPVVPQVLGSIRAGTLIAENVDLLLRAAFAADVDDADDATTSFASPYVELGGAFELRLRRTVALGASLLSRVTSHRTLETPIEDLRDTPDDLPPLDARGEDGFTELGTSVRMTLGARRFSGLLELYGRRTRFAAVYVDSLLEVPADDLRIGGRVTLDAWVGRSVRLFVAYDASSVLDLAPEISGYRSLRLMMSGVY